MLGRDILPLEEQQRYVLLSDTGRTNYAAICGWEPGTLLRRITAWGGSNGAGRGLKQALFVRDDDPSSYGRTVWNDHVQEIELEVQLKILPTDPVEEFEQLELFE